jgi:hypothetical protein
MKMAVRTRTCPPFGDGKKKKPGSVLLKPGFEKTPTETDKTDQSNMIC